ncbi:MAG: LTA synthase family protein, partial [Lentisphaeria bacterium]|nr:LTA synthase family protein [Lentisphaeria bacterium]
MARHSLRLAFAFLDERTKVFFYNAILIFVTFLPAYLFRRRAFYRVLIAAVWLLLGTVNGIVLANRVTPLTGPDFGMISDAVKVSGKYFSKAQMLAAAAGVLCLLAVLVWYFFASPKFRGKRRLQIWIPVVALSVPALLGLTKIYLNAHLLSSYFSNIAYSYLDYGFPYSLSVTVLDKGIDQPDYYSEELVEQVERGTAILSPTEVQDPAPNIIIVQLESFFDASRVRWLRTSEDPLPNWHALKESCSSGYFTVPTVGAGTVN